MVPVKKSNTIWAGGLPLQAIPPKKRVFLHGRTSQGQALIRLRSDKHAIECEYILGGCRLIFIIDSDFSFRQNCVSHVWAFVHRFLVFLYFCAIVLLLDASRAAGETSDFC